jgi:thymidylate synthase (FAD)
MDNSIAKLGVVNIDNPTIYNHGPKPKCRLIAWTPDPINLMYQIWEFAKTNDGLDPVTAQNLPVIPPLGDVEYPGRPPLPPEEETEFFQRLIKDWTGIPEAIQFTFTFTDVPVALLGQLARHRFGKLFVRSLRVFPAETFAEDGAYFTPDSCSVGLTNGIYNYTMRKICDGYNRLIDQGVPLEDARGLLPMHALYDMHFTMDLKSLVQLIQKRTCLILQQQYWAPLLNDMRSEMVRKVDPRLSFLFEPPCKFRGSCISPMEQELRVTGKDPNEPCPIYKELWGDNHRIDKEGKVG